MPIEKLGSFSLVFSIEGKLYCNLKDETLQPGKKNAHVILFTHVLFMAAQYDLLYIGQARALCYKVHYIMLLHVKHFHKPNQFWDLT